MKKILMYCLFALSLFQFACDSGTLPSGAGTSAASSFSLESADLAATELLSKSVRTIAAPNGLKISFRSSDIEFWATGGDFSNLRSLKYQNWYGEIPGANVSIEIGLSNSEDNVVFMPNMVKLSDYDMPEFDRNQIYDVARMDIGGGSINFTMNGSTMNVQSSVLSHNGALNANSIIFIDRSHLSSIVYVPRTDMSSILLDFFPDSSLDNVYDYGTPATTDFILDFVVNNAATWIDSELTGYDDAYMDVDGALFVPFDPVDFAGKFKATKVKIKLEWDLDTIFTSESEGNYALNNIAGGTPYDFNISIEIK
jgi:hypothetical protein